MQKTPVLSVILAVALVFMTPAYAVGEGLQVNVGALELRAQQDKIDDALERARDVPLDGGSFAPFEDPGALLRSQLVQMGIPMAPDAPAGPAGSPYLTVGDASFGALPSAGLKSALHELAIARGDDASGLDAWTVWALPDEVLWAMAEVITVSADIESTMRAAVADLSFQDVEELQDYLGMLQAAYDAQNVESLVSNDDFRASPVLRAPAGKALWNALVQLGSDSVRLTEATEDLNMLLLDPAVTAMIPTGLAGEDPTGNVAIFDEAADSHGFGGERTLLIDLGGDDSYTGFYACGTALFLAGFVATDPAPVPRAAQVVIDVAGNDDHLGIICGQGAGVLGAGILIDNGGDDQYLTGAIGQGASLGGVGVHVDTEGDDIYGSLAIAQGAGIVGAGIQTDGGGDDLYIGLLLAQGAGVGLDPLLLVPELDGTDAVGAGVQADNDGEDVYGAVTFAQGFGMLTGTGTAVHVAGSDLFILANPIGQLLPAVGQGAGSDLGVGTLAGGGGDDQYALASLAVLFDPITALALGQGYGGDGGAGTFIDLDGSDYTLLLSGAGDVSFGGASDDARATAGGQGLGEREGVGIYIDGSPSNAMVGGVPSVDPENPPVVDPENPPEVDPENPPAPPVPTITETDDGDGRFLASISANVALSLGETATAGSALAESAGQGAGRERGIGVLVSGPGSAANGLTADAITGAGAAAFDTDFGFDFAAAFDICVDVDFAATFGSFAETFAFCDTDARAAASSAATSVAHSEAHAGDAIATTFGQGAGSEGGVGVLSDLDGSDTYEQTANALPIAVALGVAISVTLSVGLAVANSNALAASIGLDADASAGQFATAFASQTAFARAVSISYAEADAEAISSATAEAVASVGDAVSSSTGQGAGRLNGVGALVDGGGPDAFKLDSMSKPIAVSGAVAAAAAVSLAAAAAASLVFATALATALAVAVGFDIAAGLGFGTGVSFGGGAFAAIAVALATAVATALSTAFANALAIAGAGAETEAIANALATALASATAAGASAVSVGSSIADSVGQGHGTLNGAGLLLRVGVRHHVDAVDAPGVADIEGAIGMPLPPEVPPLPADVQMLLDDAAAAANGETDGPQGDALVLSASSDPTVAALSGTVAIAFAEALAAAVAAGVASAGALAGGVSGAAAAAAAISTALAIATAVCAVASFGVAFCVAIALATAIAIAIAAAIAAAAAQAIAGALTASISAAIALASSKESAAAASATSASIGQVRASTSGQGAGSLNGFGATVGGTDGDSYAQQADAGVGGVVAALAFAPLDGACAAASSLSVGGVRSSATGQAYGQTSGQGALLDMGGDDHYALVASASTNVASIATMDDIGADPGSEDPELGSADNCGDGATASATAVSLGGVSSAVAGQASGDGVAALVDLGGSDSYSEAGRMDNTVMTGGGIVLGSVPTTVFADVDGDDTAADVIAMVDDAVAGVEAPEVPEEAPEVPAVPEDVPEVPAL